jgi:hypothetical protein
MCLLVVSWPTFMLLCPDVLLLSVRVDLYVRIVFSDKNRLSEKTLQKANNSQTVSKHPG